MRENWQDMVLLGWSRESGLVFALKISAEIGFKKFWGSRFFASEELAEYFWLLERNFSLAKILKSSGVASP